MKELAMELSYKMGFDGEITPEVIEIGQRKIDNEDYHNESRELGINDNAQYAIEGMKIACQMRRIKRNNTLIERNTI